MQIKLIKKTASEWAGNGFGNSAAEWRVEGTSIDVWKSSTFWFAYKDGRRIAMGDTRADLIEALQQKMI